MAIGVFCIGSTGGIDWEGSLGRWRATGPGRIPETGVRLSCRPGLKPPIRKLPCKADVSGCAGERSAVMTCEIGGRFLLRLWPGGRLECRVGASSTDVWSPAERCMTKSRRQGGSMLDAHSGPSWEQAQRRKRSGLMIIGAQAPLTELAHRAAISGKDPTKPA